MSVAIKKIHRLKVRAQKLVNRFNSINPLSALPLDYVSKSGITLSDLHDKVKKLEDCASIIELREHVTGNETEFERNMTVAAANFCKQHVLCPVCADRMQSRRRARYNDPIRKQAALVEDGKRFAYMVTYTVTDKADLAERIEKLKTAKRVFKRMGQKRSTFYSGGESAAIRAGVSTIEIKRGSGSGLWHVHSHDLIFTSRQLDYKIYDTEKKKKLHEKYGNRIPESELIKAASKLESFDGKKVPVSKISSEWLKATDGDSINISIEPIQHIPKNCSGKKRRMYRNMTFVDSVTYQAREVLKYITDQKTDDSNLSDLIIILNDTFNRRMVDTVGEFRGISGNDYIEPPDNEVENFVMIWKDGKYTGSIPGGYREKDISEAATDARKQSGILLGKYRRYRRNLVDNMESIPGGIAKMLDDSKEIFRRSLNAIWNQYRNKKQTIEREKESTGALSYLAAQNGIFIPDLTIREIYSNIFQ